VNILTKNRIIWAGFQVIYDSEFDVY